MRSACGVPFFSIMLGSTDLSVRAALPMPKHSRLTNSTIAITAYLVLGPLARADCVAPRALEAALRSHPDAKIFTQLGAWFDVRHQYACAAQAYQSAAKLDPHSARVF